VIPIYHFLFSNSRTYIIGGTSIGSILYRGERIWYLLFPRIGLKLLGSPPQSVCIYLYPFRVFLCIEALEADHYQVIQQSQILFHSIPGREILTPQIPQYDSRFLEIYQALLLWRLLILTYRRVQCSIHYPFRSLYL